MADPVALEEQVFRGQRAEQLLRDPILVEAFEAVKRELFEAWINTPARDVDAREWIWMMLQASQRFESVFKGMIDTGRIAQENLKYKQSLADKVRKFVN